jgi:thiamine-monophosphate kinase
VVVERSLCVASARPSPPAAAAAASRAPGADRPLTRTAASRVGAEIHATSVPLHDEVRDAGRRLGIDPLAWAIGGGEDFELLFSILPENVSRLKAVGVACYEVGRITDRPSEILLKSDQGIVVPLPGGYNHFK